MPENMISKEEVRKIAHLARLELAEQEVDVIARQMEDILEHVEILKEVDVEGVEPFISAAGTGAVFRDDILTDSLPNAAALSNAPAAEDGCFRVPAVQ